MACAFNTMSENLRHQRDHLEERAGPHQGAERGPGQVKTIKGLLPICASCKKIRDDRGYWTQIESYLYKHSDAEFTHGICPDCSIKLYPVETTPDQEPD